MAEKNWLAEQFEANRAHLRAVAYRMLGSRSEADDAVQEAWLRLNSADTSGVGNLGGWLTTVVARLSLDMLRSRRSRREQAFGPDVPEPSVSAEESIERDALLADSVGGALLIVLDKLRPAERVAFVLHDLFNIPFEDIAPIIERSPEAARQLASRARRRVRGEATPDELDFDRKREIVEAFLAASRAGDFEALLAVLDPDVVFRADRAAVQLGAQPETRGAAAVAAVYKGRARAARLGLIDGALGVIVAPRGRLLLVLNVTIKDGKIAAIEAVAEPECLRGLELSDLEE